ncbi:MAG: hypothetical protein DHS20C18_39130 [Saprospiraceae bacterium]|nr:MAG: hypothetical protein DHS20C18_39130 [Saprospiraceae bacterium]
MSTPLSPLKSDTGFISYTLESNGKPVSDAIRVRSFFVENTINKNAYCRLEIVDESAGGEAFPISDGATFAPGATLELRVGYNDKNKPVFKGVVTTQTIQANPAMHGVLIVNAQGEKMTAKDPAGVTDEPLSLTYGKDIYEFDAELDIQNKNSKYGKIRGTVKFQGSPLAVPGTLIGIKGLGKRFSGKSFVSGVAHKIEAGEWITTADIGLPPVSQSPMMVQYDKEKKVITIATPNNNQLVLSDEDQGITLADQNGNSIKLSSSGIVINSATNVQVKAEQSVTLDGPEDISLSASGGAISLSGMRISCSADTEFSASAAAAASLSSSGELSITGAMVLINS